MAAAGRRINPTSSNSLLKNPWTALVLRDAAYSGSSGWGL